MRIRKHGKLIILVATSCALFAQSNDLAVKSQGLSGMPDVGLIVESSIAATQRSWQARKGA